MSSLKTLSSNNTTLLITFLVAFIVLYILSLRIIVLPCVNCSKGAWGLNVLQTPVMELRLVSGMMILI